MTPTSWLPPLILAEHFDNDWIRFDRAVYDRFLKDLIHSCPQFRLKRFSINKTHKIDGREAIFWHLVSEGPIEKDRTMDPRRWERVPWIKPLIEEFPEARIRAWTNTRPHKKGGGPEKRIVLAPTDFSYIVVFADKETYALLISAYAIEYEWRKEKLKREYQDWKKAGAAF
ncbi:MAG: hypothetical protein A2428_09295 [Bdellovibrionales bacterium RIFOXYC1_FULL_54_43]|nr:MAG: hypothetical protein A2428_09295 [Bdellovibrionales bacterium RIFOXYC1_FULL_54_43]OFZ80883.1 MAG: hypothetical protein A2603_08185 [Bdellovibrionales bacterium RIFOXYD1_FULL_55_31]